MGKKILITGTSGYLSNNLANKLSDENYDVERISVRNNSWIDQSFEGYDVIIHTAALVHNNEPQARLSDYMRVNTYLTLHVALKAKREGVKQFIFLSTMSVYGKDGKVGKQDRITRETPLNPSTDYGFSKLKAEQKIGELESERFKVAIVRPPMIYGRECPGNFKKLRKVAELAPLLPNIYNQRSALYIEHFNEFIYQLIKYNGGGIYHPQDDFYFKTTKVMKEIRNQLHKKTFIIDIPKVINPVLNKLKLFKKLFGNLTYDQNINQNTDKIEISQQDFTSVIKAIIHSTNQK